MTTRTYTTISDAVIDACKYSLQSRRPIPHKVETGSGDDYFDGVVLRMWQDPRRGHGVHVEVEVDPRYGSAEVERRSVLDSVTRAKRDVEIEGRVRCGEKESVVAADYGLKAQGVKQICERIERVRRDVAKMDDLSDEAIEARVSGWMNNATVKERFILVAKTYREARSCGGGT